MPIGISLDDPVCGLTIYAAKPKWHGRAWISLKPCVFFCMNFIQVSLSLGTHATPVVVLGLA